MDTIAPYRHDAGIVEKSASCPGKQAEHGQDERCQDEQLGHDGDCELHG